MLEIQELSKSYGKTLAVDKVSFLVPDGQVGILLGPNGAGKSTIIKSIAGLGIRDESVFRGFLPKSWRQRRFSPMFRRFRQCLMR